MQTLKTGGTVYAVTAEQMPINKPMAAASGLRLQVAGAASLRSKQPIRFEFAHRKHDQKPLTSSSTSSSSSSASIAPS